MSDNEYLWLESPIHSNYFKSKAYSLSDDAIENMMITIDGTIMAVKRSYIADSLSLERSRMIRLGMEDMPKKISVSNDDDLKTILSYQQYSE